MKKILALFLLVLVCACAKKPSVSEEDSAVQLVRSWQLMLDAQGTNGPYRDQLSLRFGTEGDTRRVTAILWGNNDRKLRLDVMAGVGALIARIMEDGSHFLVVAPRENKAYFHEGDTKPLLKVGVPVPFNLSQLADLLNGHYAEVFGTRYSRASLASNGNALYELEGKLEGSLSLDSRGMPVEWIQKKGGWKLGITYDESAPAFPHSLKLGNSQGQKAIVLVKERETPEKPFTEEEMKLTVPPDTPLLPLSRLRATGN